VSVEGDAPQVKLMKKMTKFSTIFVPLTISFAFNFVMGTTYAFSFVLYFIVIICLVLFNSIEFHRSFVENRIIVCLL
jgi:Mg2+ and Co2+ transporter CorA